MGYVIHEEATRLADSLIADFHPHLEAAVVIHLMSDQKPPKKGRCKILAHTNLATKREKFFKEEFSGEMPETVDFVITYFQEAWDALDGDQRVALVDHELCHCDQDDKGRYKTKGHDLEEFRNVIDRHGLWLSDSQAMAEVMAKQLRLPVSA